MHVLKKVQSSQYGIEKNQTCIKTHWTVLTTLLEQEKDIIITPPPPFIFLVVKVNKCLHKYFLFLGVYLFWPPSFLLFG